MWINEALEGSESKISWCIYRRKEQDIVERMKEETKADALVVLDAGILEEFGEQAEHGTYKGAELYGVGYSLKTSRFWITETSRGLLCRTDMRSAIKV